MEAITVELQEEVRVLDGINRWRYGKDPELMAEWNSARHVVQVSRHVPGEPLNGEGGTRPDPGTEAPAA